MACDVMRLAFEYFFHEGINNSGTLADTLTSGLQPDREESQFTAEKDNDDDITEDNVQFSL